jgi:TRAP-type C4-dicarboxylate transport system permease large subunit
LPSKVSTARLTEKLSPAARRQTRTLFHGVLPFMVADVVRLAILIAFPIISLWLPSLMR